MQKQSRLKEKYQKEVTKALIKEFDIKNSMAVPQLSKVVINLGAGDMNKNKESAASLTKDMATIAGQAPSVRKAKVSISAFNLREGMPVGLTATLRGERMYNFLDKLFSIVLPRLRDFRGVSAKSFDKSGNYTLGMTEHTIFPEIDLTKVTAPHGMEITIVVKSSDPEKSFKMLSLLGMPFEKPELETRKGAVSK